MNVDSAVELVRQATWLALVVGAPMLLVSIVVGLVMGLLQAVTQVQDQSLNFAPRLAVVVVTTLLVLPWALGRLTEYATEMFQAIPGGPAGY